MLSARNAVVDLRSGRFVLVVVIFIVISVITASGVTAGFDKASTGAIVRMNGNPVIDNAMIVVSFFADLTPFPPMIIFSFILIAKRKTRRIGAILLLTIAITAVVAAYVKSIVNRERPQYEFKRNIMGLNYTPENDVISRFTSSFPSGHATRSAAFALIVSYLIRNRNISGVPVGMLMWALPATVAFSRIYMGAHYPTDVIAGVVLGIIIANVMGKVMKFQSPR